MRCYLLSTEMAREMLNSSTFHIPMIIGLTFVKSKEKLELESRLKPPLPLPFYNTFISEACVFPLNICQFRFNIHFRRQFRRKAL